MGYCISVSCGGMVIPKEKVNKALESINSIKQGNYSWVNHTANFSTLVEAINAWRYGSVVEENGDVTIEYFIGEKLGDDEILWEALAPYITKGGIVEYLGEEGEIWRSNFDGKKVKEQRASISWD